MVRALLDGRKTQTRRILKPQPYKFQCEGHDYWNASGCIGGRICISDGDLLALHRKKVGDRLWVREQWSGLHAFRDTKPKERQSFVGDGFAYLREDVWYWADGNPDAGDWERPRVSIHMPRWASRLTLTVTDVRIERVQDITEADAKAEGAEPKVCGTNGPDQDPPRSYRQGFVYVWRDIHGTKGPNAWVANPWVSVTSFDVKRKNINALCLVCD